jgi:hypothetical protein
MTTARTSAPGETRICPHCKATILRSASACPSCHHYLRYDAVRTGGQALSTFCPLRIESTIRHPGSEEPCEYSLVLEVHDDHGKVVSNQVMGIGALRPAESRTFTLRLEVFNPEKPAV